MILIPLYVKGHWLKGLLLVMATALHLDGTNVTCDLFKQGYCPDLFAFEHGLLQYLRSGELCNHR